MRIPRSIRWRLLLWYGLLLAAIITGLGMTAYHYEHVRNMNAVDTELTACFRMVEQFRRGAQNLETEAERSEVATRLQLRYVDLDDVTQVSRDGPGPTGSEGPEDPSDALMNLTAEDVEMFQELGLEVPETGRLHRGDRLPPRRGNRDDPRTIAGESELIETFGNLGAYYFCVWFHRPAGRWSSTQTPPEVPVPTSKVQAVRQRGEFREISRMPSPDDLILVGRSIAPEREKLHRTGYKLAGGGLMLLVVSLAGGWWLISRALRPIHVIAGTANRIAGGDLSQRIDLKETDSELGALAEVLNNTFARLDAAFAQQARFTADAAHELRTPVTVILTHAQNGLAADGGTEEHQEAFAACQRAAQRMRRLIDSLLQLSRIDAGEEIQAPAPCNLAEIARECEHLVEATAAEAGIRVRMDLHDAPVHGDHDRLAQVVTNLLNNAISYNKKGGEIHLTCGVEAGWAFCRVADTGQGIAPEHLPHVFERFYRADKARTSHFGKSGLGLAISKSIIDAHGGRLEVTSTLGQGSTFTIWMAASG